MTYTEPTPETATTKREVNATMDIPQAALKAALHELRHIDGLDSATVERAIIAAWYTLPSPAIDPLQMAASRGGRGQPRQLQLLRSVMAGTRLGGVGELAEIYDITRSAVVNWAARYSDMPAALVVLGAGPVYDLDEVAVWRRAWRGEK